MHGSIFDIYFIIDIQNDSSFTGISTAYNWQKERQNVIVVLGREMWCGDERILFQQEKYNFKIKPRDNSALQRILFKYQPEVTNICKNANTNNFVGNTDKGPIYWCQMRNSIIIHTECHSFNHFFLGLIDLLGGNSSSGVTNCSSQTDEKIP